MSAHILFPQIEKSGLPGTMSKAIITDLLKGKLGYTGIVVSDCLEMNAIKQFYGTAKGAVGALKAGIDLLCISHSPLIVKDAIDEIEAAIAAGEIDVAIVDKAVANILAHKKQFAQIEEHEVDVVGNAVHQAASMAIRTESISLVKGELLPITKGSLDTCVIGSLSYRSDLASSSVNTNLSFAKMVGEQLDVASFVYDISPDEAQIAALLEQTKGYSHVVVGLFNARENTGQLKLVNSLIAKGTSVTLVALGRPFDLALIDGAQAALTLLEYSKPAFESIIPVLTGELKANGQLPIGL